MHTYTIIRGIVLEGRLLLLSKLVLKHKYNAKEEVIYKFKEIDPYDRFNDWD